MVSNVFRIGKIFGGTKSYDVLALLVKPSKVTYRKYPILRVQLFFCELFIKITLLPA